MSAHLSNHLSFQIKQNSTKKANRGWHDPKCSIAAFFEPKTKNQNKYSFLLLENSNINFGESMIVKKKYATEEMDILENHSYKKVLFQTPY